MHVLITKVTSLQESVESQYNPSPSGRLDIDTASRLIFSGAHSLSIMIDWQLCQNKRKMDLHIMGLFCIDCGEGASASFPRPEGERRGHEST